MRREELTSTEFGIALRASFTGIRRRATDRRNPRNSSDGAARCATLASSTANEAEASGDAGGHVAESEYLGPVDYLAVEFPTGHVTGSGFQLIRQLVDDGTILVLDLEFVRKDPQGTVSRVPLDQLPGGRTLLEEQWAGSFSGILDQDDLDAVAAAISPGSLAGILVYENAWAAPIMAEIAASGALLLGTGRVESGDLAASLDLTPDDAQTGP